MHLRIDAPTRARSLVLLLAALAVVLAACGGDGEGAADDAGEEAPPEGEPEEQTLELEDPPDLEPVDLDEGVAAVVDGEEIAKEDVEGRYDALTDVPEIAEELDGDQGIMLAERYRAQILQNLVVQRIVANGAQELGVEPSDEAVAEVEEQAMQDFDGSPDEFQDAMEAEGVTEEQVIEEFLFAARVEAIREEVADDVEAAPEDLEAGEELDMDPADLALQQWFGDQLSQAEVQVDQEYGVWNPQVGEVVPPSMLEGAE